MTSSPRSRRRHHPATSEGDFRLLADSVPQMVWQASAEGVVNYYNAWSYLYAGAKPGDTESLSWEKIVHPDDWTSTLESWTRALAAVEPYYAEQRLRRADGQYRWHLTRAVPVRGPEGALLHWLGTSTDIQDERRVQEALRKSEARFRLLSKSANLMLTTDSPEQVVDELCRDVMAYLDGQAFFNFLLDEESGRLHLNACAGIPDQEARRIEWLDPGVAICGCVASDGLRIHAENIQTTCDTRADLVRSYGIQAYCCHPLVAQGRVLGTLSFGTRTRTRFSDEDIALMKTVADQVAVAMQRAQAQTALREANARLLESDQRKNEFIAVLSHELRNPLTPIGNSLYVLEHAPAGGNQAQRAREVIARQVNQLVHLVDDLLDVTRITRNKIQLQRARIDLCDVVRRSVEDQRSIFEQGEIRLETSLPETPVPINADTTRVAQMVSNLLQNAAKFTPRGGVTKVSLTCDHARKLANIRVVDNGLGMSPQTLARLFQPFMQVDKTLDRSRGGLGLGLALVKGLAELHGGQVQACSEGLGQGAELVVRLPLDETPSSPCAIEADSHVNPGRRVLIIEDNVDAAESLRDALRFGHHDVEVAYNGPDGLARARSFRPEVVLCDIGLPGMDGYDVARALRADTQLRQARLFALSGYALPQDLQRAHEAGFEGHLAKPPRMEAIENLLANLGSPAATPI
jgi:PAS domain S-box-containing protein